MIPFMARRPGIALLRTVAREVAAALDRGDIPRGTRARARDLLLRAWQAAEARGADAPAPDTIRDLSRRLDALLAARTPPASDGMPRLRLPAVRSLRAQRDPPLLARVHAQARATDALVERTRVMVDKAVAAAAAAERRGVPPAPRTRPAGRADLELVRGDAEPAPRPGRRRS